MGYPDTPVACPSPPLPWLRCSARTATPASRSGNGTTPLLAEELSIHSSHHIHKSAFTRLFYRPPCSIRVKKNAFIFGQRLKPSKNVYGKNRQRALRFGHVSAGGPFDYWPTGEGFDHFYGFMAADAHNFQPVFFDGHRHVEPSLGKDDYHLTSDITDRAIELITGIKSATPDRPFFGYFATVRETAGSCLSLFGSMMSV